MVKQKKWNVKHILHSLGWHFCHIRLLMHPRPLWFPFDVQHTIVLFKCTHTQTHTLRITSAGEDYEYYWNKNTHFVWQRVPLCARGCAWLSSTNLLFLVFFPVQEAFRKALYSNDRRKRGGGSHGTVTLPIRNTIPTIHHMHQLKNTHTSSAVPPPPSPVACSSISRLCSHCNSDSNSYELPNWIPRHSFPR